MFVEQHVFEGLFPGGNFNLFQLVSGEWQYKEN